MTAHLLVQAGMHSVLSKFQSHDVVTHPFPYVSTDQAIAPELCHQLIAEFPSVETVLQNSSFKSNERFSYSAALALNNPKLSPLWREFVAAHVSQAFLDQLIQVFRDQIQVNYPNFEADFGQFDRLKAGIRGIDTFSTVDVLLDAQICINTPVVGRSSSVRRAHVDATDKLFFGLFYLRPTTDDSTGGDLEVYKVKAGPQNVYRKGFVADKYVDAVNTVPYRANHFMIGLNTIHSLHGVTLRSVTQHPRLFFNLVAEVKQDLFDLRPYAKVNPLTKPIRVTMKWFEST
jgi:hypothetical protein